VFEGRFENMLGVADIINAGDKFVSFNPSEWNTPDYDKSQFLGVVDKSTLKIKKCNGYYSLGELVKYDVKNKKVRQIKYAGYTMLPWEK
jgi:hypothetical protein